MARATLRNIAGIRKNSNDPPSIWTRDDKISGKRFGELVVSDDFESHPDYENTTPTKKYRPDNGNPDRHYAAEIREQDAEKVYSGARSLVLYREPNLDPASNLFIADGIRSLVLDKDYESLFVRFKCKFSPSIGVSGQSKLFGASAWDRVTPAGQYFAQGGHHGIFTYAYVGGDSNCRSIVALRGAPAGTNYYFEETGVPTGMPNQMNNGDVSINFSSHIEDLDGDGVADNANNLKSMVDGTTPLSSVSTINHDHVWGSGWHTVEYFMKMNSSNGAPDGEMVLVFDGTKIFDSRTIVWRSATATEKYGFNYIRLGGNHLLRSDTLTEADRYEDWFAVDDLEIFDDIPRGVNI